MNRADLAKLHEEMGTLADVTRVPGWEKSRDDTHSTGLLNHEGAPLDRHVFSGGTAKVIAIAQWRTALAVAVILGEEFPYVTKPTPGADEAGFIWLTFEDARGSRLSLEVHANLLRPQFVWTVRRDGFEKRYEAHSLNDVVQSMRATFPVPASRLVMVQ